jgi:hypothetical protein
MELRDLQGDVVPPAELRGRVEQSLRERGVLRRAPRPGRFLLAAAVAALTLGAGFMMGRMRTAPATTAGEPRYALLLYEDTNFTVAVSEAELVTEYGNWARDLRGRGMLVSGEKLGPSTGHLGAWAHGGQLEGLGGFFLISAPNDSVALAIANSCPHLKHGGRIVVRKIDPTS